MVERDIAASGVVDERILDAFMRVPRENFVPSGTSLVAAYGNHPCPIGFGQTVSQPFIVAFMIQLLGCEPGDRILEIGTGSGYQTAILASMGMEIVTLELIPELAVAARRAVLSLLPDAVIRFIIADGYSGWPQASPYDGIIVSAAPVHIPESLEEQLSPDDGTLVIPAGDWFQKLISVTRIGNDLIRTDSLPVRFVPLVRPAGKRKGVYWHG
jgi:protein-L-isoaspartate(D-aspartate) O-methyltransferase